MKTRTNDVGVEYEQETCRGCARLIERLVGSHMWFHALFDRCEWPQPSGEVAAVRNER